jgi:hypothetical protein
MKLPATVLRLGERERKLQGAAKASWGNDNDMGLQKTGRGRV